MVEGGSRVHEANGGNDLIHTRSGQSIVRPTLERGKEQAASVIHGPHKSRKHEIVIHGEVVKTADGKSVVRWLRVLPGKTIVKDYIDTQLIKKKKKGRKKRRSNLMQEMNVAEEMKGVQKKSGRRR